jgi:hypothetical protein
MGGRALTMISGSGRGGECSPIPKMVRGGIIYQPSAISSLSLGVAIVSGKIH